MNLSFQQSGERGLLTISGELGLESAADLQAGLSDSLATVAAIEVDLAGVTSASLCSLQLLCSAHRTAVKAGKVLALKNIGDDFAANMDDAGFPRHAGCPEGNGSVCLWLEKPGA